MNNQHKQLLLKPLTYLIVGVVILTATLIFSLANLRPSDNQILELLHSYLLAEGKEIGLGFLAISLFLFFANMWAENFWREHIKPLLNSYISKIETSTEEASSAIDTFTTDIKERIKENNLDIALGYSSAESVQQRLGVVHERAYGDHCNSEHGLYTHFTNGLGRFLDPRVPHRSGYHQEINIEEKDDQTLWQETSEYSLHTIALDNEYKTPFDGEIEPHKINHTTIAQYTDLESLKLDIYVDDELLISTDGNIAVSETDPCGFTSADERITCKKIGDEIEISITDTFKINKAMTKIRTEEKSVLRDDHYISRINRPTYSMTHNITLPDNWKFDYFYAEPEGCINPVHKDSKRTINKVGWISPGIILSCKWSRNH